jgi:hypothetical protein
MKSSKALARQGLSRAKPACTPQYFCWPESLFGNCNQDLLRSNTRLSKQRKKEKDLLMSPAMQEHLARERITLSSYQIEKSDV